MLVVLIFGILFYISFVFTFLVYIKIFENSKVKKIILFSFLLLVSWLVLKIDGLIIVISLNVVLNFMNKMGWIQ